MRAPSSRTGVAVVVAVAMAGSVASIAVAALHTLNDFSHGIVSTPGYNCNQTQNWCRAWVHDVDGTESNANLQAGMYHKRDDGSYDAQQGAPNLCINCTKMWHDGPSGTAPCRKYAWTWGHDPTSDLDWHGLNTEACGGSHVGYG